MDEGRFSISADYLCRCLGTAAAPLAVDVRRTAAYDADDRVIVGAVRCAPDEVAEWAHKHADRPVVTCCVHGHEVSQQAAETLRGVGIDARYLAGGIRAWVERNLPTRRKADAAFLEECESKDAPFQELDLSLWKTIAEPASV